MHSADHSNASHLFCSRLSVARCYRLGLDVADADLTASHFILHSIAAVLLNKPLLVLAFSLLNISL